MDVIRISSTVSVPKHLLDMDAVRSDLFIENKATARKNSMGLALTKSDYEGVNLYQEVGNNVVLPRGYEAPLKPGVPYRVEYDLPEHQPVKMRRFIRELTTWQLPAADKLTGLAGDDKTLCLGCGKGKTILSLWYAAQRGLKTIILVDRDFLADQWIRRIKFCFGHTRDQIALMQGKKKVKDAPFTIAMIKTLSKAELPSSWYDQFGLVIVDECHMLGAQTFHDVLPRFAGERLGLSATPKRQDGMENVFLFHLGGKEPCYTDLSRFQSAIWNFRRTPQLASDNVIEKQCKAWLPVAQKRVINRAKLDSVLASSEVWTTIIVRDVYLARKEGRKVLVLGTRTEQLRAIHEGLADVGVCAGYVDADVKGQERNAAFTRDVILATNTLASRALDVPGLDTLFLLYPSDDDGFLRQAVGRIDRPVEKFKPLVVVYSHGNWIDTMGYREDAMQSVVRAIDPQGQIRSSQALAS